MAGYQIDELSLKIDIEGASKKNANNIRDITEAIKSLNKAVGNSGALSNLKEYSKNLQRMAVNIRGAFASVGNTAVGRTIKPRMGEIDGSSSAGNGQKVKAQTGQSNKVQIEGINKSIKLSDEDINAVNRFDLALKKLDGTFNMTKADSRALAEQFGEIDDGLDESQKKTSKFAQGWAKFTRSIGRIALYRAIRAVLKEITQAAIEGIKNFRSVDKNLDKSLNQLSASATALKNSFAALISPLIQSVTPAITALSDSIANFANRISEAQAASKGLDKYTRILTSDSEKYQKQLNKTNGSLLEFDTFTTMKDQGYTGVELADVSNSNSDILESYSLIESIFELVKGLFNLLKPVLNLVMKIYKVVEPILIPIINILNIVIDLIEKTVNFYIPIIQSAIQTIGGVLENLGGIIEFIGGLLSLLTGDFDKAWKHIANGFANMINGVANMFIGFVNLVIDSLNMIISPINMIAGWFGGSVKIPKISARANWKPYANGGSFNTGDYFVANEDGKTELVASTNTGGGVMNTEQLQQAIYNGMIMAMADNGDKQIVLKVDSNTLGRVVAQSSGFINETNRRNSNIKLI